MTALALWLGLVLMFSGPANATELDRYWYEYPGIVIGGATIGMLEGPEVVSVHEAYRRNPKDPDANIPGFVVGWLLHLATAITLGTVAPPVFIAYMGVSSVVGAAEFIEHGAWDSWGSE